MVITIGELTDDEQQRDDDSDRTPDRPFANHRNSGDIEVSHTCVLKENSYMSFLLWRFGIRRSISIITAICLFLWDTSITAAPFSDLLSRVFDIDFSRQNY